jgi:hypothetical protein
VTLGRWGPSPRNRERAATSPVIPPPMTTT